MSLTGTNWNGKNTNGQPIKIRFGAPIGGQGVTVTGATTNTTSPSFSYQITVNGAGIFPTPATITPPKSEADIAKENAEAFDRAMGIVG